MKRNFIRNRFAILLVVLGASFSFRAAGQATSGSHVQYGIVYNRTLSQYEVYYQANSLAPASPPAVSTAQLFILIPDAANGAGGTPDGNYTISSATINTAYSNGTWVKGDYINGPVENPSKDYFGVYLSSMGTSDIELNATNTPRLLFTFTVSGPCPGPLALIDANDPFYFDPYVDTEPNSLSMNANNNFDVLFPDGSSAWIPGYASNYSAITDPCTPLPVKMVQFDVAKQEPDALITWSTASEDNSDYFGVEKSTDAKTWTTISRIPAAGESHTLTKYTALDKHTVPGMNYYRLRLADKNGSYSYTEVKSVMFGTRGTEEEFSLYPNPATSTIRFNGVKGNAAITIYTSDGRLVAYYSQFDLTQSIDVSKYAAGTYQVKVMNSDKVSVHRLVIKH